MPPGSRATVFGGIGILARAERDAAAGAELPSLSGTGQYTRYKLPNGLQTQLDQGAAGAGAAVAIPRLPRYLNLYELGFDTRWEMDLFGGTRRAIQAAEAQRQAAVAAQHGAVVAVLAELGNDYAQLRAVQARAAPSMRSRCSRRGCRRICSTSSHSPRPCRWPCRPCRWACRRRF